MVKILSDYARLKKYRILTPLGKSHTEEFKVRTYYETDSNIFMFSIGILWSLFDKLFNLDI